MQKSWFVGLAALLASVSAFAQTTQPLPEPETLTLMALAGAVGYLVSRRKKK